MNETKLAYRVGIVVICAAVILAILILLFGDGWQSQYTLFVESPTAPNVTVNTPVRKNGIRIGRVAEVQNRDRTVLLTLKIDSKQSLYSSELCRIGTASFLGDAVLEFAPGNDVERGELLTDRTSVIPANVVVERNPVELVDVMLNLETQVSETLTSIQEAGDNIASAGEKADKLIGTFQEAVDDENSDLKAFLNSTQELTTKAETAIDNFNEFMINVNEFAADPELRRGINDAIAKLPELLDEVNTTVVDTRETINSFKKVSASADENLANLAPLTEALGAQGPELIKNLNNSLAKVDSLVNDIGTFADGLGNSDGTVSKLLNDPELYNNLNATIRNAREISERLRPLIIQLEPLMKDIRYAADGIARDPRQLGVAGALDFSPPFSKYKGNLATPPRANVSSLPSQYSPR